MATKHHPAPLNPGQFQCAACGLVYVKGWSDEEAFAEMERNFPGHEREGAAVFCDDCFEELRRRYGIGI